ncbi:MAG: tetratricopeptide repeat protein [Tatlockia sp.]|nr:tetratricopeptide repeat protein [Tatlockia sp.]
METKADFSLPLDKIKYRISRPEEVDSLFPDHLIVSFSETQLKHYVTTLLLHQENAFIKTRILLKTATIDPFNETLNYWIITSGFVIAPFKAQEVLIKLKTLHTFNSIYHRSEDLSNITFERYIPQVKSVLHNFLLELRDCIPHSPFLWFYLQSTLNPPANTGWEGWCKLFNTYNPEAIEQTREAINLDFVRAWLPYSPELNSAYLAYIKGNYSKALHCSRKMISQGENQGSNEEHYLATGLIIKLGEIFAERFKTILYEFNSKNYNKVIELVDKIIIDQQERKNFSNLEWNTLYLMSAKSHKKIGEPDIALKRYERVYPWLINSPENNFEQQVLTVKAIENLKAKVNSHLNQSDFFKSNNPRVLYNQGLVEAEQKNYAQAILLMDEALALYIPQRGLISIDCIDCYSEIASCYRASGDIYNAYIKCNMAYALASKVYIKEESKLLDIENQLRQLELTLSIQIYGENSKKCAKAYENLGLISLKKGDTQEALEAYENSRKIYFKNGGIKDNIQEVLAKIQESQLASEFS